MSDKIVVSNSQGDPIVVKLKKTKEETVNECVIKQDLRETAEKTVKEISVFDGSKGG